ncbi:hypothetical protein C8255_25990 [filamentous cyanobacterium CCP3]|nr:hypothetical protein C8255_25990 [filamentous cyanobacterium CCP3]
MKTNFSGQNTGLSYRYRAPLSCKNNHATELCQIAPANLAEILKLALIQPLGFMYHQQPL